MSAAGPVSAAPVTWRCGRYELEVRRPLVMGILNVTPDSFSDGGEFDEPLEAVRHGQAMIADGADIVDVGGESTRPGADPIDIAEEVSRVRPVVASLSHADHSVPVSVDTRHAEVARVCVESGASIVNDVSGFRDLAMVQLAASCDAGVVVMHMLGEPRTMQRDPVYEDVVAEVRDFLLDRALALQDAGVARERICLDPGFGFGKTLEHNVALMRALPELAAFGYPVMVGMSRKRMIGDLTGVEEPSERVGGSVGAAVWAAEHGAAVLRVHDVAPTVQAVRVLSAVAGASGA
jgi:dihydropteroate synthase